jgi:hypothetical protein
MKRTVGRLMSDFFPPSLSVNLEPSLIMICTERHSLLLNSEYRKSVPHVGRTSSRTRASSKPLGTCSSFTHFWSLTLSFHESAMRLPSSQQAVHWHWFIMNELEMEIMHPDLFACTSTIPSPKTCLVTAILEASRDSVVGTAIGYRLDDRGVGVRVPVGSRIFSSPSRPDRLWSPPSLLSNGYRVLFPRG